MVSSMTMKDKLIQSFLHGYYNRGFRGFYFLNRLLNQGHSLCRKNRYGVFFYLKPYSYIDAIVLKEGYYESEIIVALQPFMVPGVVVWDIGANFGLHGVTLQALYPESQIVAFEPLEGLRRRIQENARCNDIEIDVHQWALSNVCGLAPFYSDREQTSGRSSLLQWDATALNQTLKVETRRADTLLEATDIPFPNILKLDVEGAELLVLQGFGKALADTRLKVMVFEANRDMLHTQDKDELKELIEEQGFSISLLARQEASSHALANFLAIRESS